MKPAMVLAALLIAMTSPASASPGKLEGGYDNGGWWDWNWNNPARCSPRSTAIARKLGIEKLEAEVLPD